MTVPGAGDLLRPQAQEGGLLIAATRFHHHQPRSRLMVKGRQRLDPVGGVGHPPERTGRTGKDIEPVLRNIHSTYRLHHGNLPCLYDWKPNDCSVVRDSNAGPRLRPGHRDQRGNGRQRCSAGVGGHPPRPMTNLIMQMVTLSRYKGPWRNVAAPPPSPAATVPLPIAARQGGYDTILPIF